MRRAYPLVATILFVACGQEPKSSSEGPNEGAEHALTAKTESMAAKPGGVTGTVTWSTAWYYPGWEAAGSINEKAYTHVIHWSVLPNSNGSLNFDQWTSLSLCNTSSDCSAYMSATVETIHNKGLKALLGVGSFGTGKVFDGLDTTTGQPALVANLMTIVNDPQIKYDGIDIDWEPYANPVVTVPPLQYANLFQLLSAELHKAGKILTMAGADWYVPQTVAAAQCFDTLNNRPCVDQINIMSFYTRASGMPSEMQYFAAIDPVRLGVSFGMADNEHNEVDKTASECLAKAQFTLSNPAPSQHFGGFAAWGTGNSKAPVCEAQFSQYVPLH